MKTKSYSPKVSIESETVDNLISSARKAINHSTQTETFIRSNPHEHAHKLRQALTLFSKDLNDATKPKYFTTLGRVQAIVQELTDIFELDKKKYLPDQDLREIHDEIETFLEVFDAFINYDEDPDPTPITAEERLNEAWEQKMEAKG